MFVEFIYFDFEKGCWCLFGYVLGDVVEGDDCCGEVEWGCEWGDKYCVGEYDVFCDLGG